MDTLAETRNINNEESCEDKDGQIELTRDFSPREKFYEWLKDEKKTL